ncbi:glutathione S-transferase family protein [Sphingobium sp. B12D2B]|uniref:glutathione S-transferase family protein n=1 Tax=Sphingobium sp. B12D2B TaxID=2940577 RepID=UPI0022258E76|nr:glutathione S-transferase family protein [Sphingobium sp. B12D2B]MCW2351462.1 glutathione S-transferase [Sphingobium sp. B12D2B]
MLKLIIGNKVYSSWSLRGWLAAKQSGLPFETVLVPLYDEAWEARKAQSDLAVSNGKVPTLWDGDIAVWDSLAIIDYLDALSGGTRFWPHDKGAMALARSMAAEMHSGYQPLRQTCGMNTRHILPPRDVGPDVAANVARIVDVWEQARTRFGAEGEFLFGPFGAVDIMFAPVVSRFVTYSIAVPPAARAYMDTILAHPWMREWLDDAARESWVIPRLEPAGGV